MKPLSTRKCACDHLFGSSFLGHKTQGPPAGPEKPLLHTQSLSAMFKAPPEELGGHARHAVAFVYGLYCDPKHCIHSPEYKSLKVPTGQALLCRDTGGVVLGEINAAKLLLQESSSEVGHVASAMLLISTCDTCKLANPVLESPPPTLKVYGPE